MERQDLLNIIQGYPTAVLSRLVELSDKILLPSQDALINTGFEDMISLAHQKADQVFPEWTDRTKADFGEFLVELFALFSWKDFYYMNVFHAESFIRRANVYSNVALHAIRLGYTPTYLTASKCTINCTFTGVPSDTTYPVGAIEISYGSSKLVFSNYEPVVVAAGNSTVSIPFASGVYVSETGVFNGKSIRINAANVNMVDMRLEIGDTGVWSQVDSFAQHGIDAKVYMVLPSDGSNVELVFGAGGYGKKPNLNSPYQIRYRVDSVKDKNVPIGAISVIKNVQGGYITFATMNTAASGGSIPESIESIRENASMMFRTYAARAVIVPKDAITMLESHPLVYRATAFTFINTLYYTAVLKTGAFATVVELMDIANDLNMADRSVFTPEAVESSPIVLSEITIRAYIYNEYDATDIENQIRDLLSQMTDPLKASPYGENFDVGFLSYTMVERIPGCHQFVVESLNGVSPAENITLSPLQIINNFVNPSAITLNIVKTS